MSAEKFAECSPGQRHFQTNCLSRFQVRKSICVKIVLIDPQMFILCNTCSINSFGGQFNVSKIKFFRTKALSFALMMLTRQPFYFTDAALPRPLSSSSLRARGDERGEVKQTLKRRRVYLVTSHRTFYFISQFALIPPLSIFLGLSVFCPACFHLRSSVTLSS